MVCVISFYFGWYGGMRRQRGILSASSQALTMEVDELHAAVAASTNRANGLSIVLQANEWDAAGACERWASTGHTGLPGCHGCCYRRALQIAAGDLNDGYQARMDLDDHSLVCTMGHPISIQDDTDIWHANEHCDQLYISGREIRELMPYERCSSVFRLRQWIQRKMLNTFPPCEIVCHVLRISSCSFHFMNVRNQAGSIQCFAAWIKGGCRHLIGCACLGKGSCDFCGLALRVARLGGLYIACIFFTRNINTSNIFRTLNYALIRQLNYLIFLCNP